MKKLDLPPPGFSVSDILWEELIPDEKTVLCFIIKDSKVLLIKKKTGLGAGMINVPGGRLNPDEPAKLGAIRETREETGLTPLELSAAGKLAFYFTSGYFQTCRVFRAKNYSGKLISTPEADPFWNKVGSIPLEKMWEGDRLWVPNLLNEVYFEGKLIFDQEKLLDALITYP